MTTFSHSRKRSHTLLSVALVIMLVLVSAFAAVPAGASTLADCSAKGANWEAYLIRRTDTLSHVARLYGVTVSDLASWNGISNSNLIYFGTYLCVDLSVSNVTPNTITGAGAGCATTDQPITWGDTLSGISYAFGSTVRGITMSARIANPDMIFAGETLLIPPAGTPSC